MTREEANKLKEDIKNISDNPLFNIISKDAILYMMLEKIDRLTESEDCRNCKKWNEYPCGKEGHENGTSIGYSIGECKDYEPYEDCISREAVLLLQTEYAEKMGATTFWKLRDDIRGLPSVTPTNADTREAYIKGYDYGVKDWFKFKTQPTHGSTYGGVSWGGIYKEEAQPTDKCKGCYYNDDEAHAECVVCDKGAQPSEDCISRSELLRHQHIIYDDDGEDYKAVYVKDIKAMPPVTPERPRGMWLHIYKSDIACECSRCHRQMPVTEYFHYCPNCGAEMSGGGEE